MFDSGDDSRLSVDSQHNGAYSGVSFSYHWERTQP